MNSIVWCLAMLGIQIISLMSQEKEIILLSILKISVSPNPYHRDVEGIDFHGFQRVIKTSKKST